MSEAWPILVLLVVIALVSMALFVAAHGRRPHEELGYLGAETWRRSNGFDALGSTSPLVAARSQPPHEGDEP